MIKSGAVIQNRYLGNTYPSDHNPLGRPGNFDVTRPFDSSAVFDTGVPKTVSPYQPRVAESVEFTPKSVFRPRKFARQLKEINGAKWGQTVLQNLFGAGEDMLTSYMAQRLIGIVDNGTDSRMNQSMKLDDPLLVHRGSVVPSTISRTTDISSSTVSDEPMMQGEPDPVLNNLFDLSLGEAPLNISIPSQVTEMDAVAEVETSPLEAALAGGLLDIVQQTEAGPAIITPRKRLGSVMDEPHKKLDFGM